MWDRVYCVRHFDNVIFFWKGVSWFPLSYDERETLFFFSQRMATDLVVVVVRAQRSNFHNLIDDINLTLTWGDTCHRFTPQSIQHTEGSFFFQTKAVLQCSSSYIRLFYIYILELNWLWKKIRYLEKNYLKQSLCFTDFIFCNYYTYAKNGWVRWNIQKYPMKLWYLLDLHFQFPENTYLPSLFLWEN